MFLTYIVKLTLRLIRYGAEDEKIKTEYAKEQAKSRKSGIIEWIISALLCVILAGVFGFSLYVNVQEDRYHKNIPTMKVVQTDSMAKKHEKNKYLFENGLNDQFAAFDMIFVYELPDEFDLQLYDIVVYEVDDILIVHRIVGIEEPNKDHPYERHFLLQGDAVEKPDTFPVRYSQMRAIYRGKKIPFIGSFVSFMQSPAGWLCLLLVLGGTIASPIVERMIEKAKRERLFAMGILVNEPEKEEISVAESAPVYENSMEETEVFTEPSLEELAEKPAHFHGKRDMRTFAEKLADSGEELKTRFADIEEYLLRIEGISLRDSRKFRTAKCGRVPVVKFAIKGKTLNAYIASSPADYENTKYVFTDVSDSKATKDYAMRIKVTSDRQTRWTKELLEDIVERNGWTLREVAIEESAVLELDDDLKKEAEKAALEEISAAENEPMNEESLGENMPKLVPFIVERPAHFHGKRDMRTFAEKLADSDDSLKEKLTKFEEYLLRIEGISLRDSRKFRTAKCGKTPIAKFAIKGKTLNAYIASNPADYENTKYVFTDVSDAKATKDYAMRIKVTSDRQTRWTKELLEDVVERNGWTLRESPVEEETVLELDDDLKKEAEKAAQAEKVLPFYANFNRLRVRKTFAQKLEAASVETKARYEEIIEALYSLKGARLIEAESQKTFKKGNLPVARLLFKGKTLNVYLGLNPADFENTKYIFTDVSSKKKYARYPMRVKITSARQVRWVKELIKKLAEINGIPVLEGKREV
ncbi:MAG: hypothetical protein IJV83_04870 [Clostridia bacterium]|nr:hypothetical protein [Clostridia bacterium]